MRSGSLAILTLGKDLLLGVKAGLCKSVHHIRTLFFEHNVDTGQQLATDGTQDCAVVLTFRTLALIESLQFGFIADRHAGRLPECLAQVG